MTAPQPMDGRSDAIFGDKPTNEVPSGYQGDEANKLHTHLVAIDQALAAIMTKLDAIKIGSAATPAEIAKAVNDDVAVRMAP